MRNAQDRGKKFFVRGQRLTVTVTRVILLIPKKSSIESPEKIMIVENKIKLSG